MVQEASERGHPRLLIRRQHRDVPAEIHKAMECKWGSHANGIAYGRQWGSFTKKA